MIFDGILVVDRDSGVNSEITLQCISDMVCARVCAHRFNNKSSKFVYRFKKFFQSPEACSQFDVKGKQVSSGEYQGQILLKDSLDYERTSMYILTIKAEVYMHKYQCQIPLHSSKFVPKSYLRIMLVNNRSIIRISGFIKN